MPAEDGRAPTHGIAVGGITGAGVGALAGLVPTSAGPLAALITGALAGGGGNIASQTATWGVGRLTNPCSSNPLRLDFAQAGEQALVGGSTALLGFGAGFSYGYSALQGGASRRRLGTGRFDECVDCGCVADYHE